MVSLTFLRSTKAVIPNSPYTPPMIDAVRNNPRRGIRESELKKRGMK